MTTRRDFLKQSLLGSGLLMAGAVAGPLSPFAFAAADNGWHMPDEGEPHAATWMAFGPSEEVWGKRLQSGAQDNLATIAAAISVYETVNMLVREEDYDVAVSKCSSRVKLIVQPIDDLWMRDTGPVFVRNSQGRAAAVDFNLMR
jgi:agmatine deiminase